MRHLCFTVLVPIMKRGVDSSEKTYEKQAAQLELSMQEASILRHGGCSEGPCKEWAPLRIRFLERRSEPNRESTSWPFWGHVF